MNTIEELEIYAKNKYVPIARKQTIEFIINTIKEEIPWVLCAHGIFMFIANYRCEAKEYQAISPITHERSYMP